MSTAIDQLVIEKDAPIPTWFRVGGRADRFVEANTDGDLAACLELDPGLLVLGDGANLLVADEGVDRLVVRLGDAFRRVTIDERNGLVVAGAGADLSKLIHSTVRAGLTGLETIIGVPATVGGAARMNAGGAHGAIADSVRRVHAVDRAGEPVTLEREQIDFGYRMSGLDDRVITSVEFGLTPGNPAAARARLLDIMQQKKRSQPLRASTCGCAFKNPTLLEDLPGIGLAGERVGAGLLIDRAGGKGVTVGGCRISDVHANFIETDENATASDILRLIDRARALVQDRFGITLETEVVVWRRGA
ncbi:MAG: UDP-N-acetylmuramate dehydrogenase [Planctomycetota bacterium]